MRVEKENPAQMYDDFWDWLRTGLHPIWVITLFFAYLYYLMTTKEIQ
jgi:hypothetical protein